MTDLPTTVSPEDMRRHQQAQVGLAHAQQVLALFEEVLSTRYGLGPGDTYDVATGLVRRAPKPEAPAVTPTPPDAPAGQAEASA